MVDAKVESATGQERCLPRQEAQRTAGGQAISLEEAGAVKHRTATDRRAPGQSSGSETEG